MRWPPIFPPERPKPTTTPAPTTTANATTEASSGNDTSNATTTAAAATTAAPANDPTTTESGFGRKKRQLAVTTGYNYINVDIVRYDIFEMFHSELHSAFLCVPLLISLLLSLFL